MLYYLNNNKNDENANYVELTEFNYTNDKISKTLSDNLLNYEEAQAIFMINLEKLYKEYFTEDINKISFSKMEKMFNDFKLVLMLIENFKNTYKNNSKISLSDIDSNSNSKSYFSKLYSIYNKENSEIKNKQVTKQSNSFSYGLNLLNTFFGSRQANQNKNEVKIEANLEKRNETKKTKAPSTTSSNISSINENLLLANSTPTLTQDINDIFEDTKPKNKTEEEMINPFA